MTSTQKIWVALIAVAIIAIGAYYYPAKYSSNQQVGASIPTDGSVSRTLGTIYSYTNGQNGIIPGIWSDGVLALKTFLQFNAGVDATSAATSTSFIQTASVANCAAATSTSFVVANPFAATSTVAIELGIVSGQATSTTFSIGTTTKASGLALSDISPTLAAGVIAATTTQIAFRSGQTTQLGTGQVTSGAGSIGRIVVGPSESVAMFATSTFSGIGALNYTPGLSACSFKLFWNQ